MGDGRGCFELAVATATIFLHKLHLFYDITEETIFYVDPISSEVIRAMQIFSVIFYGINIYYIFIIFYAIKAMNTINF